MDGENDRGSLCQGLRAARNCGVDISPDLDKKEGDLSLFTYWTKDEREERIEGFRARVQVMLRSGGSPSVGDCERCLEMLIMCEFHPCTKWRSMRVVEILARSTQR